MAEIYTQADYTIGYDSQSVWSNNTYAWDGDINTCAYRLIGKLVEEALFYLRFTSFTPVCPDYKISKVEVGICHNEDGINSVPRFKVFFGGTNPSTTIRNLDTQLSKAWTWIDVTTDNGAPSPWTHWNIDALDVSIWGYSPYDAQSIVYIYEVALRVTARALYYELSGNSRPVQLYKSNSSFDHWLGMYDGSDPLFAKGDIVGSDNESDLRYSPDGINIYSIIK